MLKIIPFAAAVLLALSLPLVAQDNAPVLRVIESQDQIIRIRAKTRHTTVIVLPVAETVLDFVVGDSEYWHLTGAANLAFLKPIAEGVTTNVALVCESGKIYSFLVSESGAEDPHLVVRIEAQGDTPIRAARLPGTSPPLSHGARLRTISKWRRRPSKRPRPRRWTPTPGSQKRGRLRQARANPSGWSIPRA